MSLNPAAAGRCYESGPIEINRSAVMFYALSVGDRNDAYFDERRAGGVVAHPLYAAVYARIPVRAALLDPAVGICYEQLFHYEQSFRRHAPVRPGDVLSTQAEIKAVRFFETGGLIELETVSTNGTGCTVLTGRWAYFDKSAGRPNTGRPERREVPPGPVVLRTEFTVPEGQTFVYAEASGDRNPLHLDEDHARRRGLSGIIVHGSCTLAHCAREIVDGLCDKSPSRLGALSVRFSHPVYPGERLVLEAREAGEKGPLDRAFALSLVDRDGRAVLRNASFEIASEEM